MTCAHSNVGDGLARLQRNPSGDDAGIAFHCPSTSPARLNATLLVLDFDGTITQRDTLDLICARYAPRVFADAEERFERGEATLEETIRMELAAVPAGRAELLRLLRAEVSLRPGLAELLAFCRLNQLETVVLSAGVRDLIEPFLVGHRITLPIMAARAVFGPAGITLRPDRDRSMCDVCGERCKRADLHRLATSRDFILVGDGVSDLCAAGAAALVFARDRLADILTVRSVPFVAFSDFYEVRTGLAAYLAAARDATTSENLRPIA